MHYTVFYKSNGMKKIKYKIKTSKHKNYFYLIFKNYELLSSCSVGEVAERSMAADCKSALLEFEGSNPSLPTIYTHNYKQYLCL